MLDEAKAIGLISLSGDINVSQTRMLRNLSLFFDLFLRLNFLSFCIIE